MTDATRRFLGRIFGRFLRGSAKPEGVVPFRDAMPDDEAIGA